MSEPPPMPDQAKALVEKASAIAERHLNTRLDAASVMMLTQQIVRLGQEAHRQGEEAGRKRYEASGPFEAKALDCAADHLAALQPEELLARAQKIEAIIRHGSKWIREIEAAREAAEERARTAEKENASLIESVKKEFDIGSGYHKRWMEALDRAEKAELAVRTAADSARREALDQAAKVLEGEAEELRICAESYHESSLGRPRQTMLRQASSYRDAAERVRALAAKEPA